MVSQDHDEDTDYSDLDEEPVNGVASAQRHSAAKDRERLNERTPLLSNYPPPPSYSDVTRGNAATGSVLRDGVSNSPQDQGRSDPMMFSSNNPQSMGNLQEDPEDCKKHMKRYQMRPNIKALSCLALVLLISIVVLSVIGAKHSNKQQQRNKDENNDKSPPSESFPHRLDCPYDYISDREQFGFHSPPSFSFVELAGESNRPSSRIHGQVRIRSADENQSQAVLVELRVAKSSEARQNNMKVVYTAEHLEINTPPFSNSKACLEIDVIISIKPGLGLDNFEIATENLDVRIEPGMSSLFSSQAAAPNRDGSYISNTTNITAGAGDVSVAYWASRRETIIDVITGRVSGRFALMDLLEVKTQSGSIDVNVEPKPVDKTAPKPAEFTATSQSGSVRAVFPTSGTDEDIPEREYHTKVDTQSGSISGSYLLGIATDLRSSSGSIDVTILPYSASRSDMWLRTETQGGRTEVDVLSPFKDPENTISRLRSFHKARSGSVGLQYPQQWEGTVEASTLTGSITLGGKDVKELRRWHGPVGAHVVAQKGDGSSSVDIGTSTGSIDAVIGDYA